jgi:hypothetical protein
MALSRLACQGDLALANASVSRNARCRSALICSGDHDSRATCAGSRCATATNCFRLRGLSTITRRPYITCGIAQELGSGASGAYLRSPIVADVNSEEEHVCSTSIFRRRSARLQQAHHRPQFRDNGPYFRSSCGPARAELLEDFPFSYRSALPWSGGVNACP